MPLGRGGGDGRAHVQRETDLQHAEHQQEQQRHDDHELHHRRASLAAQRAEPLQARRSHGLVTDVIARCSTAVS